MAKLPHNIAGLREAARRRAHRMVFDYIDGAADDEATLSANSSAFDDWEFLFRVLVGVERVETSTTLLGMPMALPFFCSSSAGNRLFHTEGECAVARVAHAFGIPYSLSTLSTVSIEEVAALTQGPKFFQLYVWRDRALLKDMIDRVKAAGYAALILTVDFAITGNRERDIVNGFAIPPKLGPRQVWEALKRPAWTWDYVTGPAIRYANLSQKTSAVSLNQFVAEQLHAGFDWKDAEWLLGEWNGPAMIKGVVRPDDARRAVDLGFQGVIVSNHGGRQLDHSVPPLRALPAIVDRIGGDAEVVLDGGVRRGTDVLKALALGARAVSFARPYLYGLAAAGEVGVRAAIGHLADAVRRDMALVGARSIAEITPDLVTPRSR